MPLYDVICSQCEKEEERYVSSGDILCADCGIPMRKLPSLGVIVKMKGEGGYPSRHRQVFNTTKRKHPSLT